MRRVFFNEKTRTKPSRTAVPIRCGTSRLNQTSDDVDQTIKIMIKNENRMLNDEIIGVSKSLSCFQTRKNDRCAGTKRENEGVGNIQKFSNSIERKYRRQRGKKANEKMEAEKPKKMDTSANRI